jgi:hypothetical protein
MYLRLAVSILLAVVLVRRLGAQDAGSDSLTAKVRLAEEAATRWLALVDAKRYGASWDNAAASFKKQVSGPEWQAAVTQARSEVDPLGARRLLSSQYTRELPDAPAGEYVVIVYSTAARNNARVVETITLMLETSGAWRVAGYFIRPE